MKNLLIATLICLTYVSFGQGKKQNSGQDSTILGCGHTSERAYQTQLVYDSYMATNTGNFTPQSTFSSSQIVRCGHFRVYYQDLLNTPAIGFADPTVVSSTTIGAQRRNTFCAVLSYMQSVIQIPSGDTIDVYVDASLNPTSNPAPSTTAFVAHATSYFPTGQLGSTGFFAGNTFKHITTGIDPDPTNYDAYVQFNFDKVYNQLTGAATTLSFWDDYLTTTASCKIDLYSVMLHEMTHALGWFSFVIEDNTTNHNPINYFGASNTYSRFDSLFLYCTTNIAGGSFTKIVQNSPIGINPSMSSFTMPLRSSNIWLYNNGTPINQPVYSGDADSYNSPHTSDPTNGSYLSHMNDNFWSFTFRAQYSPGYQPNYLMAPAITWEMLKREWTLPELRALKQFGYTFNYPFSSSYSNSGTVSSTSINNTPAFRNNYKKTTEFINFTDSTLNFPEAVHTVADFTITTNNNTPSSPTATQLVINLASDATLHDNEGNTISAIASSVFNIRGCGSGGNNHNCLALSGSGQTFTYTPRPGFRGRAQFGFYLTDGNERGGLKIYTIDVQNINSTYLSTLTTFGSNLIMNPSYEEGTEVRQRITAESIENTSSEYYREGQYCTGSQFSDNHIFAHLDNAWSNAGGIYIQNSWKACGQTNAGRLGNYGLSNSDFNSNGYVTYYPVNPVASTSFTPADRYSNSFSDNYSELFTPTISCHRYRFEADMNFQRTSLSVGQTYTMNLNFTTQPTTVISSHPSVTINQQIPVTVTVTTVSANSWQHVSFDFNYCGSGSSYLNAKGAFGFPYSSALIDNLSLKEISTVPFTVAITNSNPSICVGACSQLTAVPTNPSCIPTYTWTGGSNSNPISVCPNTTTNYTLTANDGCSTATAVTTVTVSGLTAPTITISPTASPTVCAGSATTFTASGASTYTWNTGPTTSTISVAPSTTTGYTVTGTAANGCTGTGTKTVTVNPLPIIYISGTNSICPTFSTSLTASGANTYTWSPGTGLSCTTCATTTASPSSTTTYTISGTDGNGCVGTTTFVVNVIATPTLNTTATPTVMCSGQTATLTVSGASTYTWNPSGSLSSATNPTVTATPTITTIYTVSGNNGGCTATKTVTLTVSTCTLCTSCTTLPSTITTNPGVNGHYCLGLNTTISGNIVFSISEFKIAASATVTVPSGSSLTINDCHLYACSGMWQGITVAGTGSLTINNNSFVEDALLAVATTTTGSTPIITLDKTVFNKNYTSLSSNSYTGTPSSGTVYPINITSNVFTSRRINPLSGPLPNWPSVATVATYSSTGNPLQSPYLNAYPVVVTCLNGAYPMYAIQYINSGTTTGAPTSPTYYEFMVGQSGANKGNIFDSHYNFVLIANANVTIVNSVFQNALYTSVGFPPTITIGSAITGSVTPTGYSFPSGNPVFNDFRVRIMPGSGTSYTNSFYNNYSMCDLHEFLETNITYNNCYSTAASSGGAVLHRVGETGFNIITNRYNATGVVVSNNNFYNIGNPILFTADISFVAGSPNLGRYGGQVTITNNYMRPHIYGNTITNQFIKQGVSVNDIMTTPSTYSATTTTLAGTNINISNNIIDSVWYGIHATNFGLQPVYINQNYISMNKALNGISSPTNQYGINMSGVASGTIVANYVNNNINTSEHTRAITTSSNAYVNVNCNQETGGYRGIEFNGSQTATFVGNQMANNTYGMVLDNSGVIGMQGNSTSPRFDQWTGTWGSGATPYKTATYGSGSSAQNSKLWIKNTGSYNPDGSGYTSATYGSPTVAGDDYYGTPSYSLTTIGYAFYLPSWSCPTSVPTCTNCRGVNPSMSHDDSVDVMNRRELMERIAGNFIKFDRNDSAIGRYIGKMHVYRNLRGDTSGIFGSRILRAFKYSMRNSNIEKIFSIEDAFVNGDYNTVQSLMSSITPVNAIEQNHIAYYNLFINYKNNVMTHTDSVNLLRIAQGCPFTDGNVVFQARALYNMIHSPYVIFSDNCNASRSNKFETSGGTNEIIFDADVYPNPNSGKKIFIAPVNMADGNLQVKMTDVEGRIIFSNSVSVSKGTGEFNLDQITSGVYFVHISNLVSGEHVVKKLVIQY